MDVFDLRTRLVSDYQSYTRSFINIRDPRIAEFVDNALNAEVFWPEPLLQLNPTTQPGWTIDDLEEDWVDEESTAHLRMPVAVVGRGASMAAYLFVWNPKKWHWETLDQRVEQLSLTGQCSEKWSCAGYKSIRVGDRAFLLRLGSEPKGIMGSGFVITEPFLSPHWSGEDKLVHRVIIDFDTLLHPDRSSLLGLDVLQQGALAKQVWTPEASGISIKPDLVPELEETWFEFILSNLDGAAATQPPQFDQDFPEGAKSRVEVTRYERNPHARRLCIEHHGLSCVACGVNFEERYGEVGAGFIQVHHLNPVSMTAGSSAVDPVDDLRPVCPNCHAMLHRKRPPYTIDELLALLDAMAS
jgi:5-methylcytosine-specific restriction protein A